MTSDNYAEAGFERLASVIDPMAIELARDWIVQHRTEQSISSTRDVFARDLPGPIKLRRLWQADQGFWTNFLLSSGVLEVVRRRLGQDCRLIRSACFIKYPRSGSEVGWHRDIDLWGHAVRTGATAWIPLTASKEDSGCLQFLAGSHRREPGSLRFDPRHPYHRVMDPTGLGEPVLAPADVGDCILMDGATAHSSGPNRTDDERIALVLAFADCPEDWLTESAVAFEGASAREIKLAQC